MISVPFATLESSVIGHGGDERVIVYPINGLGDQFRCGLADEQADGNRLDSGVEAKC